MKQPVPSENRPVVVGAGGLVLCAIAKPKLASIPLLIEREMMRRTAAVEHNQTGQLDLRATSNLVSGGAGTFSDGKSNTGN